MDVFEKSLGIKVFSPLPTVVLRVFEPSSLADLLEETGEPKELPQIASFTFAMYDHKFPVTLPFEYKGRRLFAIVLHKSCMEGGHYALLVKVHGKWYIKEDARVYELPCQVEVMRGEFYMAFYRPDNLLK